jgi:hypothetical protein
LHTALVLVSVLKLRVAMRYIEEENETPKNTPMMPLLHQTKRCPLDQSWLHVPVQTAHKPPPKSFVQQKIIKKKQRTSPTHPTS